MAIHEAAKILKMHTYYQSCSYEYAWQKYTHPSIKDRYEFEEVMKHI